MSILYVLIAAQSLARTYNFEHSVQNGHSRGMKPSAMDLPPLVLKPSKYNSKTLTPSYYASGLKPATMNLPTYELMYEAMALYNKIHPRSSRAPRWKDTIHS